MRDILALTVNSPHLHWPGWLTGFGGGVIVGFVICMIIVHRSKYL
jgi:hypothetical protein